jgi:putative transcription antitermination factor YqgF
MTAPIFLGIDYGKAHTGLAISEHGLLASALTTIHEKNLKKIIVAIRKAVNEHHITDIVVGVPYHLIKHITTKSEDDTNVFIQTLQTALPDITIHQESEQMTSKLAAHFETDKQHNHEKAAELILQQFLDRRASKKVSS